MRVHEQAKASVSTERVACRFHPEQALVVNERAAEPDGRKIVVHCPICMQLAHSHEERERCSMTLATELHSSRQPERVFSQTSRAAS